MKKLSYLFFLPFLILFSCSDDDSGDINVNASGQITLDGSENISLDYAALEGVISSGNHYSFHLSFFDKEIDYQSRATTIPGQGVDLYFNFFSPCPESIKFGDFEYISPLELTNKTPEEGFFTVGTLTRIIGDVPEVLQINEGTVSISKKEGEGDLNLTVSFDLEFSNGKSLTGEYSGKVEMVGDAEIDEECEAGNGDGSPDQGEGENPSLGESTFELNSGIIVDSGSEGTHYKYSFFLSSEEEINIDNDEFTEGENYVVLQLHSAGIDAFKTGTFNLISGSPFANQNYLGLAQVTEAYNPEMPQTLEATLGSVEVERMNDEFTLTFDLTLNNGQKLTGSFGGAFPIYDAEDIPPEPVSESSFTWDGVSYEVVDLIIEDYGAQVGHYNYDFLLLTKTINELDQDPTNYHLVQLTCMSWGNSSFSDGTFPVNSLVPVDDESVQGKNYVFLGGVARFGDDPDAEEPEKVNLFTSGTVTTSKQNDVYTIEFGVTLDDNEKIKGFYSGGFTIIQLIDEGNPSGRLQNQKRLKNILKAK